jgi:hypothetical protein
MKPHNHTLCHLLDKANVSVACYCMATLVAHKAITTATIACIVSSAKKVKE